MCGELYRKFRDMLDPYSWLIVAMGFAILCIWVVIPIREFREIFAEIRKRDANNKR